MIRAEGRKREIETMIAGGTIEKPAWEEVICCFCPHPMTVLR